MCTFKNLEENLKPGKIFEKTSSNPAYSSAFNDGIRIKNI